MNQIRVNVIASKTANAANVAARVELERNERRDTIGGPGVGCFR